MRLGVGIVLLLPAACAVGPALEASGGPSGRTPALLAARPLKTDLPRGKRELSKQEPSLGRKLWNRFAPQYEFRPEEEVIFSQLARVMRYISRVFAVHGVLQVLLVIHRVQVEGLSSARQFLDCIDELFYAYLLAAASSAFFEIERSQGSDLDHLMSGTQTQARMWKRFRKPLTVKTIVLLMMVAWAYFEGSIGPSAVWPALAWLSRTVPSARPIISALHVCADPTQCGLEPEPALDEL